MRSWFTIPLAVILIVVPLGADIQQVDSESIWSGFDRRDLRGREWSAESLEGRVVVLDFWATWCAPCLAEIPRLRKLYRFYRDDGLEILGVSLDQTSRRELRGFLRSQEMEWPQFHDGRGFSGDLALSFGVDSLPRTFLIDSRGRIVASDLRGEHLEAAVRSLLSLSPQSSPAAQLD